MVVYNMMERTTITTPIKTTRKIETKVGLTFIIVATGLLGLGLLAVGATATKASLTGYFFRDSRTNKTWYAEPTTGYRYDVTSPARWKKLYQRTALIISTDQLNLIPVLNDSSPGDDATRARYSGRVVTTGDGLYWYVYPGTKTRYATTDSAVPTQLLNGNVSIALMLWPTDPGIRTGTTKVQTRTGSFTVKYLRVNRINPDFRLMTDNTNLGQCHPTSCTCGPESSPACQEFYRTSCPLCRSQSFGTFIKSRGASAGINGTYFFNAGGDLRDTSLFIVMNSYAPISSFTWGRNPLGGKKRAGFSVDTSNRIFFDVPPTKCEDTLRIGNSTPLETTAQCVARVVGSWSTSHGGTGKLQALVNSDATLVLNRTNVISQYTLDSKQKTAHSTRNGIGFRGNEIWMFVVYGATVPDAAAVATAMKFDNAVNLDGGGSSTLYANGQYLVGPGRAIPNAILIAK